MARTNHDSSRFLGKKKDHVISFFQNQKYYLVSFCLGNGQFSQPHAMAHGVLLRYALSALRLYIDTLDSMQFNIHHYECSMNNLKE